MSLRTFQGTLMEMGVTLTSSEVQTIVAQFSQPEDNRISYEAFCKSLDSFMGASKPAAKPAEGSQKQDSKDATNSKCSEQNYIVLKK